MELKIAKDENDMARQANTWLEERARRGLNNVFLPAGGTPRALYRLWREHPPSYLAALSFTQIDEVASGVEKGTFERFFRREVPELCARINWVRDNPPAAALAILGFGTNGHIAFHEPGLPDDFEFGIVDLSAETVKKLGIEAGAQGLSFGLGTFAKCRSLLLLIGGANKDDAFQGFLRGDPDVPAARLKNHADLTVIIDSASVDVSSIE